jgi:UrcA family protein
VIDMKTVRRPARHVLPLVIALLGGACMHPGNTLSASELGDAPAFRTVQIRASDLSTPEQVAALYRRIRNAARSVCGYADNHFREEQAAWDDCVDKAIGHAVAKVGNADLTDYYLARAKRAHQAPATEVSRVVERVR